jgi:hypothetical protein
VDENHLDHCIDQIPSGQVLNGGLEHGALDGRYRIRNDYDEAGMQFHLAEKPYKVHTVICDERELIFDDSAGEFPVRLAAQPKMVHVACFESSAMTYSDQRLMQAFVD